MARIIQDAIALLNRLIQRERGAISAYKTVLAEVRAAGDTAAAEQLVAFIADHRRHVDELAFKVRNLGGEPPSQTDLRSLAHAYPRPTGPLDVRTVGPVSLETLRTTEADTLASYADAVSQPGIPVDVREVLESGLRDERRHQSWVAFVATTTGRPMTRRVACPR